MHDTEDVPCQLTVFIRETDQYHHRPLYAEIVRRARRAGLARASAFQGLLGFSAPDYPRERRWSIVRDTPVLVMIVDTEDRLRAFLPILDEVMDGGLATLSTHAW
jgi:uncharacterized protein